MDIETIETIVSEARTYLPEADLGTIRRAYNKATQAHQGQVRDSGEAYIHHALSVAHKLAELRLDASTIAAGLLHDTVEQTALALEQIQAEFGDEVARLVDGLTKLSGMDESIEGRGLERSDREAENLRKMLLAMVDDPRVILIKLADRLHNMRTLRAIQDAARRQKMPTKR